MLTATPPASTRSWESVVSLVWRQPEWLPGARSFLFNLPRKKKNTQHTTMLTVLFKIVPWVKRHRGS